MKKEMYDAMFEIERTHWWFRAKADIVDRLLDLHVKKPTNRKGPRLLDVGCGCGLMLQRLSSRGEVSGLDFSETALAYCRKSFTGDLRQCDLNEPLTLDQPYDAIVALDVLEHIQQDATAVQSLANALAPGGVAIITVPAHPWMWSRHDENCYHQRRYTKKSLEALLNQTGLRRRYLSYYNCSLFPPIVLVRLLEKVFKKDDAGHNTENQVPSRWLNQLFYHMFRSERACMACGIPLPWGVSLIAVLEKTDESKP